MKKKTRSLLSATLVTLLMLSQGAAKEVAIKVQAGDSVSLILHSVGATPLYGSGNSLERHQRMYPKEHGRELEVGDYVTILSEDIRFKENLQANPHNYFTLKKRLYTTSDLKEYVESLQKLGQRVDTESKPGPVAPALTPVAPTDKHEDHTRAGLDFAGQVSLYLENTSRSLKDDSIKTKTSSSLQAGLIIKLEERQFLANWFLQAALRPWLGESEGLDPDYAFSLVRDWCTNAFICSLGLGYERFNFVSRSNSDERRADALMALVAVTELGYQFSTGTSIKLGVRPFVSAEYEYSGSDVEGLFYHASVDWFYTSQLGQFVALQLLATKDKGAELSGNSLLTGLSWNF